MKEKEWQTQVLGLAKIYGWAHYHTWTSIKSVPGWPDLVLCRPPRIIFAELKTETGKATEAQAWWLDLLSRCDGVEVALWRPQDLGRIDEVLRR